MSEHSYEWSRNQIQILAQSSGGTGGLCLEYTTRQNMEAARENTGCFRSGRDEKMQRGQSVTLVTVEQMVCVRRHARKQFLPPAWGRKAQVAPWTWMLSSLKVRVFVCVWNSRHPPALHDFLKAVVYFQNVSPLGSCGSREIKGTFLHLAH